MNIDTRDTYNFTHEDINKLILDYFKDESGVTLHPNSFSWDHDGEIAVSVDAETKTNKDVSLF